MRTKQLLIASAAVLALPALALAQQTNPQAAPATPPVTQNNVAASATSPPSTTLPEGGADETAVEEVSAANAAASLAPPSPPIEYPGWARRDPWSVGPLPAGDLDNAWGSADGRFLSTLMRRMRTPIASRWAHIALRNALLVKVHAPPNVHPVDWVAERAWLLLRMGEADAARMLVAGLDADRFTPKMVQVGVQSALATSDPAALCPLEDGIRKYDPAVRALVQAMCASLAGTPETASGMIDQARRYGRIGGVDLALAEKVVGAGTNGRASTIEWDPVQSLTAWRFGLATSTGLEPPDRLIQGAPVRLRAFAARAPMLTPRQRLPSAVVAAGLGVFSSQSMVDLYSQVYDTTDPGDLAETDVWQLRQGYVGKDAETRLAAIVKLLGTTKGTLQKEGMRALTARAAGLVEPDASLAANAPELIAAMLAGGYDRAAARWIPVVNDMDDEAGDRCWAMLALAAPNVADVGAGRVAAFIRRDHSRDKLRSALLVAGLAGLGRISGETANDLNRRYGLGLGRVTSWTRIIDDAARRGQAGTVLVLTGTGLQTSAFDRVPAAHLYHAVAALNRTGQGFTARMIAAEGLSRT